jgi:phosphinothricin acetyltransferase
MEPTSLTVRRATPADAAAIAAIYNQGIAGRSATFETEPRTEEDRRHWIEHQDDRHPILVAETNGRVVGWTSVSAYRARDCYSGIGEFSVYVHAESRGLGVGRELLTRLIEEVTELGYWKLLSRVFDFNQASRNLCRACGCREVGVYEKHGKLDGRWIDCVIVERLIDANLT